MRRMTTLTAAGLTALLSLGCLALAVVPAVADATDTPSAGATATPSAGATVDAGSSFLTAAKLTPGQSATVAGSTGDYLYWSFPASAGDTVTVTATVQLPAATARHGAQQWRLDLYDGLRRLQPCTAGDPAATASATDGSVALDCTLPRIRSWAETWSNDPLPGTYYLRLTLAATAEVDLGQPFSAQVRADAASGDAQPAGGQLQAPLTMPMVGGATPAPGDTAGAVPSDTPSPSATPQGVLQRADGFFSEAHARWWWTGGGAILGAIAGIAGYTWTRHPRRWFRRPR